MYLKEVIIEGFKSFADRTKIILGPGVTTIVGPNGCGKSNIVDAIRWVLGEQSPKALRGGKMNDVIFEGTDTRAQMPICEVSLIFSDCEKELGTAFNEVQITRKVSRESSGSYYINGRTCRLKDIQQLFMDTGIGRVSYSFMVQGQIDQILSTNPEERRVIFEEAAGITRYKSQRKEALAKLALVDQNLSRVQDVIDEVGRQITSLKRQASKAIRYKRIHHRLKHLDLAWNAFYYKEKNTLIQETQVKVETLRKELELARAELQTQETTLAQKKEDRRQQYDKLQFLQQAVFDIVSKKDQAENQVHICTLRQQDFKDRRAAAEREITSLEKQQEELSKKLTDSESSKDSQLTLVDASDQLFNQKNKVLLEAQENLRKLETSLQKERQLFQTLRGDLDRLQSRKSSLEVDLQTSDARAKDLVDNIEELSQQKNTLAAKINDVQAQLNTLNKNCTEAQSELESAQAKITEARNQFRQSQALIQDQDRAVAKINAQLNILEGLQARFEGFSESTKAIMKGKLEPALAKNSYDLLTKYLDVAPQYLSAFETLLGMGMDAVTIKDISTTLPAILPQLENNKWAKACFAVPLPAKKLEKNPPPIPSGFIPAHQVIKCLSKDLENHVATLFEDCYFCDTLDAAIKSIEQNPAFTFTLLATPQGELIDRRGLIFTANYQGQKKKESGFIQREAEIRQLQEAQISENKKLEELSKNSKEAATHLENIEAAVNQKQAALSTANQQRTTIQLEERSLKNTLTSIEQKQTQLKDRQSQLQKNQTESQEKFTACQSELQSKEENLTKLQSAVNTLESDIAKARQIRDSHMEVVSEIRVDLAEKKQMLQHLTQGLTQIEQRKKGTAHMLNTRTRELTTFQDEINNLAEKVNTAKTQVEEFTKTLAAEKENLESQRQIVVLIEKDITEIDALLTEKRKFTHERESQLSKLEVQLAEATSQERFIVEKMSSEYHVDIQEIDWVQQLWLSDEEFVQKINLDELEEDNEVFQNKKSHKGDVPSDDELELLKQTDWKIVKKEIDELKSRSNSLGAVNLVAIEEYVELKERFAFLKAQVDDLTTSKNELVNAIDEINKTSEVMFKDTFEKVRNNFMGTFDALFGGGQADLLLQAGSDILESGIEIVARPPGTKLKSLTLLSGGQKTMTAVALLFAIYKVKPSPFCVLDELDAPLDDANIGRFVDMLKGFTQFSQFLVISHNKRTIAASDTIYGVTMQEKGVTRLISMRFNKADINPSKQQSETILTSNN